MKAFILCSAFFALAASVTLHSDITPKFGFVAQADGKMFFADATQRIWTKADEYCKAMGMELAEVTSKAQADALKAAYNSTTFSGYYWLNARDSGHINQTIWERSGQPPNDEFLDFSHFRRLLTCLYFQITAVGTSRTGLVKCDWTSSGSLCEFVPPS